MTKLFIIGLFVTCYQAMLSKQKMAVDLPEEINLVSKDKNKPDTLVSFIQNDTLFIGFKH